MAAPAARVGCATIGNSRRPRRPAFIESDADHRIWKRTFTRKGSFVAMTEQQKAARRAAREEQRRAGAMLEAEERSRRSEVGHARHRAKYEQYDRDGLLPTRASLEVGGPPCPGCGKPYVDGGDGWPPTMHVTAEEAAACAASTEGQVHRPWDLWTREAAERRRVRDEPLG